MNPRITITRKDLFAIVTLDFDDNNIRRRALMTMDKNIKANDPRVLEFKRRVLRISKPKTKRKRRERTRTNHSPL